MKTITRVLMFLAFAVTLVACSAPVPDAPRMGAVITPGPKGSTPMAGAAPITIASDDPVGLALLKIPAPEDVTRQIQRVLPAPFVGPDYSPSLVYSSLGAVATTALIRGGPAQVLGFTYEHTEAAAVYLQLYDKLTGVASNDVPKFSWLVEPSLVTSGNKGGLSIGREFFGISGVWFQLGLSWATSTDPSKYTAISGTAAKHTFNLTGM